MRDRDKEGKKNSRFGLLNVYCLMQCGLATFNNDTVLENEWRKISVLSTLKNNGDSALLGVMTWGFSTNSLPGWLNGLNYVWKKSEKELNCVN